MTISPTIQAPPSRNNTAAIPHHDTVKNMKGRLNHKQISQLRDHFKDKEPPTVKKISEFIQNTFQLTFNKSTIAKNRRKWDIPTNEKKNHARSLTEDEKNQLRNHFQGKEPPTDEEILTFIHEKFKITPSIVTIRQKREPWGIPTKEMKPRKKEMKPRAPVLNAEQISQLCDRFKDGEIPTLKKIQEYIQDNFSIKISLAIIQKMRRTWGIPTKFNVEHQREKSIKKMAHENPKGSRFQPSRSQKIYHSYCKTQIH